MENWEGGTYTAKVPKGTPIAGSGLPRPQKIGSQSPRCHACDWSLHRPLHLKIILGQIDADSDKLNISLFVALLRPRLGTMMPLRRGHPHHHRHLGRSDELTASGALASLLASGAKLTDQALLINALDEDADGALPVSAKRIGGPLLFGKIWERLGVVSSANAATEMPRVSMRP